MKGFIVSLALCCCALPIISPLHSGGTDGAGGHYNHSTGEYHYHHGYPAHQHPNGECPYDVQEEDYDCGREDCDSNVPHGHINKPKTTTTTKGYWDNLVSEFEEENKTTNGTTKKQEKDSVSDNDKGFMGSLPWPLQLLLGVSIAFFPLIISLIYGGFVRIKDFITEKRKKEKH